MSDIRGNNEVAETDNEMEMQAFCAAVGELILWGSAIDSQLTKAVIRLFLLKETPMLESVIAELPTRTKIALLRADSKHISAPEWRQKIKDWANKTEKVNDNRNIVAHHQAKFENGKLILFSLQATKLLKRIDGSNIQPAQNIDDISKWIDTAKETIMQGETLLQDLEQFVEEYTRRQIK